MENKCKRFLSLLLALVMVAGLMPVGHAHAEETAVFKVAEDEPCTDLGLEVGESAEFVIVTGEKTRTPGVLNDGNNGQHVTSQDGNKTGIELLNVAVSNIMSGEHPNAFWTIARVEDGYTICGQHGTFVAVRNNNYVELVESSTIQIRTSTNGEYAGYWEIYNTDENGGFHYLNYFDSFGNATASGWAASSWQANGGGSQWKIYKVVEKTMDEIDPWGKRFWTEVSVDTETIYDAHEGEFEFAWDNNPGSHWHSNWQGASDKLDQEGETFTGVIDFGQTYTINQFSFTPRTDRNDSGIITQASLYVKENESDEWTAVAEHKTFANDGTTKTFCFEAQSVQYVKFVAEQANDGWVTVSEFDINYDETHSFTRVETPATCLEDGYTTHSCSCGYSYTTPGATATGHIHAQIVRENEVAATCTEDGSYDAVVYCAVCSVEISREAVTVDALGHTDENGDFKCDVCGNALCTEHERVTIPGKAATCTETGLTDGAKCAICGEILAVQEEIPAMGHTAGAAATCTTAQTCTVCGAELAPATGHQNTVTRPGVLPTLTTPGKTDEVYCNDCQTVVSGGEELPALTVKNAKVLSNNTVIALEDCEYVLGGTEGAYSLSHGGTYYVMPAANGSQIPQTTDEFSNLALVWQDNGSVWINGTLPSSGAGGGSIHIWTAGKDVPYWDRCGSGHGWNSSNGTHDLYLFRADANSTNAAIPGYTQVTAADVQVGESYLIAAKQGDSTWYIMYPAATAEKFDHIAQIVGEAVTHEHTYTTTIQAATCTADGLKTDTCDCGHIHTEVIPATGEHSYEAVVTAPTCTEAGFTTYTCAACGDSYVADEVAALGHSYEAVVTAPTCTEGGYTTYTCAACGDSYVADETAALGHTEVIDEAVAPTCTETGLTEGKHCSVCGEILVAQEVVDALGHSYEAVVTAPTCTEGGYTTYTCAACGDSYVADETAALGHDYVDGICGICGEADPDYVAVIASGWSGYTTWKLTEDGVLTFAPTEQKENGQTNLKNYWKVDGVLTLPWGDYAEMITKVVIEEGIHDIGQMAFYELPNLVEVQLPDSVVEIRNYAFKNCTKLTTINLEVVEVICEGAFYGCAALEDITFAEGVVIEEWAFSKTPVQLP